MFTLARKLAPCIIFIDEIDALLEKRSSVSGRSSRIEIVNEFMSQWDGLASNLNAGVIVMGATNRPFVLDDAVLRRLPRRLLIDLPVEAERLQILRNLISENLVEPELEARLPDLARRCQFYSGSDLKNVAITAGLKAALRCSTSPHPAHLLILTLSDFEAAIREVPASLSDQMDSLQELRRWNAMYGEAKEQWKPQKFGFA
jgi:SpoVK/Ycf46/Vps4 family AAA+-type ATPase